MTRVGRLEDKIAVVTGAGSGLGRAAARLFAAEGARVYVVDRDAGGVEDTAEDIGDAATVHPADVSSASDMEQLAERVLREHGRADVVFANAGVEGVGTAADLSEETWRRVIDIDLMGVWLSSKYFLPSMVERGSGSIVNTASVGGLIGVPGIMPYAAAKGGVVAMTRQMAVDYAPNGIRVNAVCPGTVVTPLVVRNWEQKGQDVDEQTALVASRYPLGRAGQPIDVAAAALFLASDEASWITGQALAVDGGLTAM